MFGSGPYIEACCISILTPVLSSFPHSCQEMLLDSMTLGPNIAKNAALRENVFMMTICIELRIPLFLVGKPGSSKSLAKSIVQSSMQGNASNSELLKGFKQASEMSVSGEIHTLPLFTSSPFPLSLPLLLSTPPFHPLSPLSSLLPNPTPHRSTLSPTSVASSPPQRV